MSKFSPNFFRNARPGYGKNTDLSPGTVFWDPTSTNQNVGFCKAIYKIIFYKIYKKVDTLLTFKGAVSPSAHLVLRIV